MLLTSCRKNKGNIKGRNPIEDTDFVYGAKV